ncbi:uncharacterized protein METZ01_LOCUS293598, partial [marine metagenome]
IRGTAARSLGDESGSSFAAKRNHLRGVPHGIEFVLHRGGSHGAGDDLLYLLPSGRSNMRSTVARLDDPCLCPKLLPTRKRPALVLEHHDIGSHRDGNLLRFRDLPRPQHGELHLDIRRYVLGGSGFGGHPIANALGTSKPTQGQAGVLFLGFRHCMGGQAFRTYVTRLDGDGIRGTHDPAPAGGILGGNRRIGHEQRGGGSRRGDLLLGSPHFKFAPVGCFVRPPTLHRVSADLERFSALGLAGLFPCGRFSRRLHWGCLSRHRHGRVDYCMEPLGYEARSRRAGDRVHGHPRRLHGRARDACAVSWILGIGKGGICGRGVDIRRLHPDFVFHFRLCPSTPAFPPKRESGEKL